MKILIVAYACGPGRGSESGVGWELARALAAANDVVVLTRSNNRRGIEQAGNGDTERLRFIYHDLGWLARLKRHFPGGLYFYHYLWQLTAWRAARASGEAFDVAHQLTLGSFRFPSSLGRLGVPVVHGPLGGAEESPFRFWRGLGARGAVFEATRWMSNRMAKLDPLVRRALRRDSLVLAASPDTARVLISMAGPRPVVVFPSIGIEAPSREPARSKEPSSKIRVLFVGRFVPWKGAHLAIETVAAAHERDARIELTLLGRGPQEESLRRMVRQLGAEGFIEFVERLPSHDDVMELYRQHDVFLFPSLHDSGGMAVIEAMAAGLPVVCLQIGGPAVSVHDGVGYCLPAHSPRQAVVDMCNALVELAADPQMRTSLGQRAFRSVSDGYSWPGKAIRLMGLYEEYTA